MQASFSGVFPILATPFTDEGQIDVASQLQLVDHLLEQGVHGLGAFGNASEGYALLPEEKSALLDEIVRHVDGRVPVIVGIGATGTAAAVQACQQAEAQGATGLMVLPPFYVKPDGDSLLVFYSSISDAVGIPIMVQDAPLLSQVAMPPPLLARMAGEIEHVECVKVEAPPTAPKISRTMECSNGALTLFGGLNGQFMIEECQRGSRGIMPASDMAAVYVAIWDAMQDADMALAWDVFSRALPLIRYELQPGLGVSAIKHSLVSERVIRSAFVRHPGRSLDAAGLRELKQLRSLVWPV